MTRPDGKVNRPTSLVGVCWLMWLLGSGFVFYAISLAVTRPDPSTLSIAVVSSLVGSSMILAGWGLFKMRRWGIILFGLLVIAGSINHLVNAIYRFPDLSSASIWTALGSIVSVLGAFLIPIGLMYIVISLWQKTR